MSDLSEIERLSHDIERHVKMASDLATDNERLHNQLAEERAKHVLTIQQADHFRNQLVKRTASLGETRRFLVAMNEHLPSSASSRKAIKRMLDKIDTAMTDEGHRPLITDQMVDRALNAWFASPPSETDQGLERSMYAALEAALTDEQQ